MSFGQVTVAAAKFGGWFVAHFGLADRAAAGHDAMQLVDLVSTMCGWKFFLGQFEAGFSR